jgi:hypothetical protein
MSLGRFKAEQPNPQSFQGFALPTSNTLYCPNQFFDVCLPHSSRGCVRLVGYLLRQTLGWSDPEGKPLKTSHSLSYSQLEEAGISRDQIRPAIAEAVAARFIRCVESPRVKGKNDAGQSGVYELNWDEGPETGNDYIKDPKHFRGFFAGEGNRTYIPNQFFDQVVRNEPLSVVKVVGSIIRFSIGFQNKWGHRRRQVALSYQHIQRYTHIGDRKTLAAAVKFALNANYIQRVEEGYFDPNAGKLSKAAVYAIRWLDSAVDSPIGQKTRPEETRSKYQSENPTGIGQKTLPADRSENPTGIEITNTNKTLKQQAAAVSFRKLRTEGFDTAVAQAMAERFPAERIERQIAWMEYRTVKSNRLGLLRAAIEQDWPLPARGESPRKLGRPNFPDRESGESFADALAKVRQRLGNAPK